MVKAVIFDLWGVTATKKHWLFDEIRKEFNLDNNPHPYFVKLLEAMEIGALTEAEFWLRFSRMFHIDLAHHNHSRWLGYYETITIVNEQLLSLVRQLRQQGYKVAVMSNTDMAAVQHLKNLGIVEKFDKAIFSCEVAVLKPDEKIYRIALKKLSVQPEEAVFIDDKEAWVRSAKRIGMHGFTFKNIDSLRDELQPFVPGL